jgi:hypothetical protein
MFAREFSPEFLRVWTRGLISAAAELGPEDLIDECEALVNLGIREFEVLLMFMKPPHRRLPRPREWREARDVSTWLSNHGFRSIRQHGGLLLTIRARDPYAAGQAATEVADRLRARAAVGTRERLEFHGEAYVAGHGKPIAAARSRRAEVRALEREKRLLDLTASDQVDQALELLSHLNTAPSPVAAAGGWSAVESLLSSPGDDDKVITAERLANLVACSWPRAELTTIAWARVYQAASSPDQLADEIEKLPTNRARADRILTAIREAEDLTLVRRSEQLALRRMEKLVASPRQVLLAVRERAGDTLRRLYRQRNLVVHGGKTAGAGLSTAVRLAAPLVGAGIDRITHSALVGDHRPVEIAARAQVEIERAGTLDSPALTAMLE